MSTPLFIAALLATAVVAALAGWLWARLRAQAEIASLRTTIELERRGAEEKAAALAEARQHLSETFGALSAQALKHNTEEFLKLAQENLKQFQIKAQGDLEQREKAIEHLVKPIRETLEKTERQMREIEKERKEAYGSLHEHLTSMARAQESLQGETRNLVQALRRPEVRGQWGELTLKRLAELAGMVEHCDFFEQEHTRTEEGSLRPDMIVRMPDGREVVVDVKTPLDAYLSAVEAPDDEARRREMQRHARKVRERVKELAGKAYWSQFQNAPDFVVLFIPGEQFLSAALELDRDLLEDALRQKVILATPTSFVALLRAIAYGWRQSQLAENAEKIRQVGEDLFSRLVTFTDHLARVGRNLDSSLKSYNQAVGSFDGRVLPGARKFSELGISSKKDLESLEQIETGVRRVEGEPADE
ncbi:MAG: DNA recombination protein RmuC [Pseudolabrys sp.]